MAEPLLSSLPFKTVSDGDKLETVFRTANDTVHDADLWLSAHEQLSNTHWVVRKTYPAVSKLLYRKDYVCHHSSLNRVAPHEANIHQVPHNRRGKSKNARCFASLVVKIFLPSSKDHYAKVSE